jgi:hypothetical protein
MTCNWEKLGLVYECPGDGSWRHSSALTPTAIQLSDCTIRVYAGFRDQFGVSRIGYVDVDAATPNKIKKISNKPSLDVGAPGMFDDNGVILGDIIKVGSVLRMYYVGFQLVNSVKFLAYSGVAISEDFGETFERYTEVPILDRADEGKFIRAIHSVQKIGNEFWVWYAVGNGWEQIDGVPYPQYDINILKSSDGLSFGEVGQKCIRNNSHNAEYRIGRPRVFRDKSGYVMNFTYGTLDGRYQAGQAKSNDGLSWNRDDSEFGLMPSKVGWDSLHLSYPCIVTTHQNDTFMFYNGNNMGSEGFGVAKLTRVMK